MILIERKKIGGPSPEKKINKNKKIEGLKNSKGLLCGNREEKKKNFRFFLRPPAKSLMVDLL